MKKSPLKKPILVYFVAFCFIASPIVNFWLSTQALNLRGSFSTIELIRAIKPEDLALNILIFITGALLLKTHKLTWMLAILSTIILIALNISLLIQSNSSIDSSFIRHSWMSLVGTVAGGLVLFYARFPYLDRRDTWTGTASRFAVKIPVEIEGHGEHVIGNVSSTGARIDLISPQNFQQGTIISLKFKEAGSDAIKCRIITYNDNVTLRVQFLKTSKDYKSFIKKLKDQSETSGNN